MRIVPEVIVVKESALDVSAGLIERLVATVDAGRAAQPSLDQQFVANGWTSRAYALGLVLEVALEERA